MTEKEVFIGQMKKRTKKFAVEVILFCDTLKTGKASSVITYQLVKSATSTGANYRAACKARSKKEFFSKICIVVEEVDESEYRLGTINDAYLSDEEVALQKQKVQYTTMINDSTLNHYSIKSLTNCSIKK